jgi:adenine-specific DNA-methyltransferase
MNDEIKAGNVEFIFDKGTWVVYEKIYEPLEGEFNTKKFSTWFDDVGTTSTGTKENKELFNGSGYFDFPKPTNLISILIKIAHPASNDIILDFFSGSATTAHAVMQLNAKDGGKRKFIMVQIPEACDEKSEAFKAGYKTIADIGKERIRRAGQKIKADNPLTAMDLDIGFRVLKVDSSNMNEVYYSPDTLNREDLHQFVENIRNDRSDEDLLFQVLLDWGVDLTLPIISQVIDGKTVFIVAQDAIVACFDRAGGVSETFIKELAAIKPLRAVFCDSGFANDSVKINVEQIFKMMSPSTDIKTI